MTETATTAGPLDRELAFTETYRGLKGEHIAIREALCLKQGRLLHAIQPGDVFAGRHVKAALDPDGLMVGFGLEHEDSGRLYFCDFDLLRRTIEMMDVDDDYRARAREMLAFWEEEDAQQRYYRMLPEEVRRSTTGKLAHKGIRLAGVLMDYDKLVRLGLPGLRAKVEAHHAGAAADGRDPKLYEGMLMALDLLVEICQDYAAEARALAGFTGDADLLTMAADLEHIASAPPRTLRQGIQLCWLYSVMAGVTNFGRMDVCLGDLYVCDLEAGRITEEEALRLVLALWGLIADAQFHFNSRVIVGGMGRRNEAGADRFALLAMEASRLSATTEPQLSLRFHQAQDPALMEKAIDCIADGGVYPILYNDDVNVPAAQNAFGVPRADAEHYLPYGCGEYGLDHLAFGSPNTGFNLLKAVQAAMHNGVDPDGGERTGPQTGEFAEFGSFEQLWDAYARQVEYHMACVAKAHAVELEVERTTASFLYASMLFDDCLERGRSLVDGGARYLGGIVESTGLVNAADCLTAIKKLVYDERRVSPGELLRMLEADWAGHERERRMFLGGAEVRQRRRRGGRDGLPRLAPCLRERHAPRAEGGARLLPAGLHQQLRPHPHRRRDGRHAGRPHGRRPHRQRQHAHRRQRRRRRHRVPELHRQAGPEHPRRLRAQHEVQQADAAGEPARVRGTAGRLFRGRRHSGDDHRGRPRGPGERDARAGPVPQPDGPRRRLLREVR